MSTRQRPTIIRQRVSSPTTIRQRVSWPRTIRQRPFSNVSHRQRLVPHRVSSLTTIRQRCSSPTTIEQVDSTPTCQIFLQIRTICKCVKFTDYGTIDYGSSSVQHLVRFKFTDYGTFDCGSSSVQHLVSNSPTTGLLTAVAVQFNT